MADAQEYLNSLNEAMAIHAQKAIEGLQFDRTELAEIVDITNRNKGEYQVFNGSIRYFAYSENTSYTLGTKVYVTIPNNDYTQQKTIKGKYKASDDNRDITWVPPLSKYKPLTSNLIENSSAINEEFESDYVNSTGYGLIANYNSKSSKEGSESVVLFSSRLLSEEGEYNQNFQYVGLRASFKTLLDTAQTISGSYGLYAVINYHQKKSGEEPQIHGTKVCRLDTATMIGNPYHFDTFYEQEALFEINSDSEIITIIDDIQIVFYQDGEFRDYNNELIGVSDVPNIFVKDIGIWFGDEIDDELNDYVEIYTNQGLMYDSAQENPAINEKRIDLKWMHKNPDQEMNDEGVLEWIWEQMNSSKLNNVPNDTDMKFIAKIHWFTDAGASVVQYQETHATQMEHDREIYRITEKWKYAPNQVTADEVKALREYLNFKEGRDYTYNYVEEYPYNDNGETYSGYLLTITPNGEKILDNKVSRIVKNINSSTDLIIDDIWYELPETENKFEIIYQPDINLSSCKVKCVVEYGPTITTEDGKIKLNTDSEYYTKIESNILIFENRSPVPDPATLDHATGVTISINDNSNGRYPLYNGVDGKILARKDLEIPRVLSADVVGSYTKQSLLEGNSLILWKIPKTNTMINISGTLTNGQSELVNKDKTGYLLSTEEIVDSLINYIKEEYFKAFEAVDENDDTIRLKQDIRNTLEELANSVKKSEFSDNVNNFHTLYQQYLKDLADTELEDRYSIREEFTNNTSEFKNVVKEKLALLINDFIDYIKGLVTGDPNNPGPYENSSIALEINTANKIIINDFYPLVLEEEEENSSEPTENEEQSSEIISGAGGEETRELSNETLDNIITESVNGYDLNQWFNLDEFDFDNFYYIVRFDKKSIGINPYQIYYINETYVKSATNNTITCYLVHNGQIYEGHIDLIFSQHGSSGTDYTFSLSLGPLVVLPGDYDEWINLEDKKEQLKNEIIEESEEELSEEDVEEAVNKKLKEMSLEYTVQGNGVFVDSSDAEWVEVGAAAPALTIGETAFRRIQLDLYNANNELIKLTNDQRNAIIKLWVTRTTGGFYSGQENAENIEFLVKQVDKTSEGSSEGEVNWIDVAIRPKEKSKNGETISIENLRYIILAASIRSSASAIYNEKEYELGNINFTQLLPIHIRTKDEYYLNGSDYITYDDAGANPQCYNIGYNLENCEGEIFTIEHAEEGDKKWLPTLDENNQLQPSPMYVSGLSPKVAIEAILGKDVVYSAPLLIIQNKYQIPALNSWNGKLLVDADSNRVMAATIAAGKKDKNNTFTGVIMGTVQELDQEDKTKVTTTSGLYGYEKGEQAFGFLDNGTGFIGKSGTGRIKFDGNKGFIQSANYSAYQKGTLDNLQGTKIDLDDGSIDMWGIGKIYQYDGENWSSKPADDEIGSNISTNIHLDVKGTKSNPYFKIEVPKYNTVREIEEYEDENGNKAYREIVTSDWKTAARRQSLIQIDSNNFYLQTADYPGDPTEFPNDPATGLRIDLRKGEFDSKGPLTINGARGSQILFGDEKTNYLRLKFGLSGSASLDLVSGKSETASITGATRNLYKYGKQILDFLGLKPENNSYLLPKENTDIKQPYYWPVEKPKDNWPEDTTNYYDALNVLIDNIRDPNVYSMISYYKDFSVTLSRSDVRKLDPKYPKEIYYDLIEQEDGSIVFEEISINQIKEQFSQDEKLTSKTYFLKRYLNLKEEAKDWDKNYLYTDLSDKVKYKNKYYRISSVDSNINKIPGESYLDTAKQFPYWTEITDEDELALLSQEDINKFDKVAELMGQQNSTVFKEANEKYLAKVEEVDSLESQISEASTEYEQKRQALNNNLANYKLDWEEYVEGNEYNENDVVMFRHFLYKSKIDNNDNFIYEDLGGSYQFNENYWEQINPDTEINTNEVPVLTNYHKTAIEDYLYALLQKYEQEKEISDIQKERDDAEDTRKKAWDKFRYYSTKDKIYIKNSYFDKVLAKYEEYLDPYISSLDTLNKAREDRADSWIEIIKYLNKDEYDRYENIGNFYETDNRPSETADGVSLRIYDGDNGTFVFGDNIPSEKTYDNSLNLYKQILIINQSYKDGVPETMTFVDDSDPEHIQTTTVNVYNKIWLKEEDENEDYRGNNLYDRNDIAESGYIYKESHLGLEDSITISSPQFYQDILFYYDQEEDDNLTILDDYVLFKSNIKNEKEKAFQAQLQKLKDSSWNDWMYFATNNWKNKTEDIKVKVYANTYKTTDDNDKKEKISNYFGEDFTFEYEDEIYELYCDGINPITSKMVNNDNIINQDETLQLLDEWLIYKYNDLKDVSLEEMQIRVEFSEVYEDYTIANNEYIYASGIQTEYLSCSKIPDGDDKRSDFIEAYNHVLSVSNYDESDLWNDYVTKKQSYEDASYTFPKSYWSNNVKRSRKMKNFEPVYDAYLIREDANERLLGAQNVLTTLITNANNLLTTKTNLEKTIGFEKIYKKTELMASTTVYKVSGSKFKSKTFKEGDLAALYSGSNKKNAKLYISLKDKNKSHNPVAGANTEWWMEYETYMLNQYQNYQNGTLPWVSFYIFKDGNIETDIYKATSTPNANYNYNIFELDTETFSEEKFKNEEYYKLEISEELENKILDLTVKLINAQIQEQVLRNKAESLVGYHYEPIEKLKYSEIGEQTYYTFGYENAPAYSNTGEYQSGEVVSYLVDGETKYFVAKENTSEPPIAQTIGVGKLVDFDIEMNESDLEENEEENITEEESMEEEFEIRLRVLEQEEDDNIPEASISDIIQKDVEIYKIINDKLTDNSDDIFNIYQFESDGQLPTGDLIIKIKDYFNNSVNDNQEESEEELPFKYKLYQLSNKEDSFDGHQINDIEFDEEGWLIFNTTSCEGLFVLIEESNSSNTSSNQLTYQPAWTYEIGGEEFWDSYELQQLYTKISEDTFNSYFGNNISYWDESVTYQKDQKVLYDNEIYVSSISNNLNYVPGTGSAWTMQTIDKINDSLIYIKISDLDTLNELDEIIKKKIIPTLKGSEEMNQKMITILGLFKEVVDNFDSFKEGNNEDTIKLSSTNPTRLLIGTKFKVNSKGEITATGGTIGGWTIGPNSLSSPGITINGSSLRANNGAWRINSDGTASFANVNITGGNIDYGGNTWGAGGLNFGSGGIAGGVGYSGSGGYGGSLGSTFKYYDDHVQSLTVDVLEVTEWMHATKAQIDNLISKEITADSILVYVIDPHTHHGSYISLSTAISDIYKELGKMISNGGVM